MANKLLVPTLICLLADGECQTAEPLAVAACATQTFARGRNGRKIVSQTKIVEKNLSVCPNLFKDPFNIPRCELALSFPACRVLQFPQWGRLYALLASVIPPFLPAQHCRLLLTFVPRILRRRRRRRLSTTQSSCSGAVPLQLSPPLEMPRRRHPFHFTATETWSELNRVDTKPLFMMPYIPGYVHIGIRSNQ